MNKLIRIFLLLFSCLVAQEIDYDKLDLKYYPYIAFYEDTSDKAIKELVEAVDKGEEKTGLFLGIALGGLTQNKDTQPYFSYGVKLGYQSFLPSFFGKLSYPGMLGDRVYIQYYSSFLSQKTIFGKERFSNISIAYDVILDLPVFRQMDAGVIVGVGLGSSIYGDNANSRLSFLINTGIGTSFWKHHRIDFELKIIPSFDLDWFCALFTLGYNYVF